MIKETFIKNPKLDNYKNIDRNYLISEIYHHVEENGFNPDSADYYKYGLYNTDEELLLSDEINNFLLFVPDDVYLENYEMIINNNFKLLIMKEFFYLEPNQRELQIECCVLFAESLLDLLIEIFFCPNKNLEKKTLIKHLHNKINNSIEANLFIEACGIISNADDIPEIINDIVNEKCSFTYKVDKDFILKKRLLNLLDYESLLKEILLGENNYKPDEVLDKVNCLDVLVDKNILNYRSHDGRYEIICKISTFWEELLEIVPDIKKDYILKRVLNYDGTKLSKKYLKSITPPKPPKYKSR